MKPNGADEQLEMSSRIARNPTALNGVMKNRSAEPYSRTTPPHFKGRMNQRRGAGWGGRQGEVGRGTRSAILGLRRPVLPCRCSCSVHPEPMGAERGAAETAGTPIRW